MKDRERYIEKMKLKLDEWNADIDRLEAKAELAEAEMKGKYKEQAVRLKQQRDEAAAKLKDLQNAGDDAWDEIKAGLEKAWDSIGDAFKSAKEKFK